MQPLILLSLLALSARALAADAADTTEADLENVKPLSNTNLSDLPSLVDQAPMCVRGCLSGAMKELTANSKCKIAGQKGEKVDWACLCGILAALTDDSALDKMLDKTPECQKANCDDAGAGGKESVLEKEVSEFGLALAMYCLETHSDALSASTAESDTRSKSQKSGAAPASSKVGNLGLAGLLLGGVVGFFACSF